MRGVIQKLLAMGINMTYNIQEKTKKMFERLEGSRIKKRGLGACLSVLAINPKKGANRESCEAVHNYFKQNLFQ
jgi:hypothetical protein